MNYILICILILFDTMLICMNNYLFLFIYSYKHISLHSFYRFIYIYILIYPLIYPLI